MKKTLKKCRLNNHKNKILDNNSNKTKKIKCLNKHKILKIQKIIVIKIPPIKGEKHIQKLVYVLDQTLIAGK